ncbi:hypothetical protein [Agromyces cerinus]|uniref:Uncharacterized protein n=1 Tax=Agromyces cerinus subsp. cerinus TaxID=232089 RepID=A0A1N6DPD0_9MICO|nr:hypothetical protein [Agromyces cerinus]SIN72652.1 hypothetical protein SAMN05443544_0557 [Agromyces cerinus subsp. cerinus]
METLDGGELVRIRSIKPEFWRSSDISSLAIEDRLLFVGLWSYVDDNGVGRDKLSAIAADLFADDLERDAPETFARVSRGLARLSEAVRIVRYTVAGDDFLRIVNWSKHQRIDKPGKARYPSDDADDAVIRESVANIREGVAPGTGEQRNRGTGEKKNTSASSMLVSEFERAWPHWPKKTMRKQALDQFKRAFEKTYTGTATGLADWVIQFGDAYEATTERQYVPALSAWLRGERWTDELPSKPAGRTGVAKADVNFNEYERLYGGGGNGGAGSVPALDPGVG